jgi:hypothetical protein
VIAALLLALLRQEDVDVLTLKDGTTRAGRIVSESASQIVLEALIKGAKGQIVGSAKVSIEKDFIRSVQRASEEARRKAADRSTAFGSRAQRRTEALAKMKVEPLAVDGLRGFRVEGAHSVLESTCEVAFTKDVALCLEEVFGAYRKFFDVRRNAEAKVIVHLFDDKDQYAAFQVRRHGAAVMNPAYYHSEQNYIAAYNMVQKAEERRVRSEIVALERQIDTWPSWPPTTARRSRTPPPRSAARSRPTARAARTRGSRRWTAAKRSCWKASRTRRRTSPKASPRRRRRPSRRSTRTGR